ncbi:ABC transporter permease [Granulosicoccus sp. 3-233]|uniref:ABC transporter permease n=1 Tax=Granulosicoccus sp. 3-233 TaxID=3417969 RepID=UPI003D336A7C
MSREVSLQTAGKGTDFDSVAGQGQEDARQAEVPFSGKQLQWSDIKGALTTQSRVIHALIMRETLSRYGDHKLGFMWAILEPLLMVTMIASVLSVLRNDSPGGMPLVPFMITGFVPFFMFRNTMNQLKGAVASNRTLLGFPQVTTFDVIIARALLEGGVLLSVFVFILSMAYLIGFEFRVENPLGVLGVCLCLLLLGSGIGFILATLIPVVPSVGQVSNLIFGRPLMVSSGLFFTADSVPEPFRGWLLYNPILNLMELMRTYFFYEFESNHGSWFYAGSWVVGTFTFGLLIHQALKRRAIVGL